MLTSEVAAAVQERGGGFINSSLKSTVLYVMAAKKSQQVIRKNIENKTASIILVSYKAGKCPYPEYCVVALHVKKDNV